MVSLPQNPDKKMSILSHSNGNGLKRWADSINGSSSPINGSIKRVRIVDPAGTTAMDVHLTEMMVKKLVNNAIEEQTAGKPSQRYDELRKKFSISPREDMAPSTKELRQMISALTYVVSQLNHPCSSLVYDIVNTKWAGRDDQFFRTYLSFLLHVVSAHSNYVFMVTKMLVKHLALQPSEVGRLPGNVPVTRKTIFNRTHIALKALLDLVPTGYSALFQAIQSEFPHKDQKRKYHTTFITNLLRILDYAPVSRTKIVGLIFEKVMQVDVEIQVNLDDLEEDEGETLATELNGSGEADIVAKVKARMAAELDDGNDNESDEESDSEDEGEDSVKRLKETVQKLDAMLEILFTYFSSSFPQEPVEEPSQPSFETFELLLHFFDVTVLPTFRSRYTQFILFWAAQKSPRLSDIFLGMLLSQALDMNKSQVSRQAASAYAASFVARAETLSRQTIRDTVTYLCAWLERFTDDREKECNGADVGRFSTFYAITQAVMYIFCFRWKELKGERLHEREDEDEMQIEGWSPGLKVLDRLITSKFNPLKVCSPVVVNQFARLANHFGFVYCYSIMERNKRMNFHSQSGGSSQSENSKNETPQLQSFFPFDPYKLTLSRCWVDNIYVEWQGVKGLDDDEDDDEEEEEEDDEDEEEDDNDDDDDEIDMEEDGPNEDDEGYEDDED